MGAKQSTKLIQLHSKKNNDDIVKLDTVGKYSYGVADQYQVQHFLPPNFPVLPVLLPIHIAACQRTWDYITEGKSERMKQYEKPGIVLFYDEFFYRLFQQDTTLEDVFPDIKRRIGVLIKAIMFILASRANTALEVEETKNESLFLGHKHRSFSKVRAHQFATYASCLTEVIMYWLDEFATPDVGKAWSNVVCFHLRYMMESLLNERIDPYESYQNVDIGAVKDDGIPQERIDEKPIQFK